MGEFANTESANNEDQLYLASIIYLFLISASQDENGVEMIILWIRKCKLGWGCVSEEISQGHTVPRVFPVAQMVKNLPAMQKPGLIPGWDAGEGNDNTLQYSCLENSMHR